MAWSLVFSDDFTGTNGDPWDSNKWSVVENSSSVVDIQSNRGRIQPQGAAYTTAYAFADMAPIGTTRITGTVELGQDEQYTVIAVNADGTIDGGGAFDNCYFIELQRSYDNALIDRNDNGNRTTLGSAGVTLTFGNVYQFIIERDVDTDDIRFKIWEDGTSEPGSWTISVTDSMFTSGITGLQHFNGNSTTARTVFFDDFEVYKDIPAVLSGYGSGLYGAGTYALTVAPVAPIALGSRDPDFTVRLFMPLGTPQVGLPLDEITFSGIDTTFSINDEIPGGFGRATIGGVIQRDNQIVPAWLPRPVADIVPFAHTVITAGMEPIWEGQAIKPQTDGHGEIVGFEAIGYWSVLNDHEFASNDDSIVTTGDILRELVPAVAPILNIGSSSQFTDPQVSHALEDFDAMTGGAIWDQISKEGDGLGMPVDLAVWHDRTIWSQRRQAPAVPQYVLQPGAQGVSLSERPWDELWARVRTRYTDADDDEQVTDWQEAEITDAPRNRSKTLSGGNLTEAAAEQIARLFLNDHAVRRWGATVTLDDGRGMPTYDGGERSGYLVRPGEWADVPGYHPMVILKRSYDSASRTTTLMLDHQPRDWQRLLDRLQKTTEFTREGLNPVTGGRQR